MSRRDGRVDLYASLGIVAALVFCLLFWTGVAFAVREWAWPSSSSRPDCKAGASSIALGARAVTTWYPKGCRHG